MPKALLVSLLYQQLLGQKKFTHRFFTCIQKLDILKVLHSALLRSYNYVLYYDKLIHIYQLPDGHNTLI